MAFCGAPLPEPRDLETVKPLDCLGPNVLMIYPRFTLPTFWNLTEACKLFGARYPNAPLGLITVAGMLPQHWNVRLVDLNIEEVTDEDFRWADMVMTGGMIPQQVDLLRVIGLAHSKGKPVVVGGPDPTSSPHIYAAA